MPTPAFTRGRLFVGMTAEARAVGHFFAGWYEYIISQR
jgi:hypothetical protein